MGDLVDLSAERWRRRGHGFASRPAGTFDPHRQLERSLPDGWQPSTTLEPGEVLISAEAGVECRQRAGRGPFADPANAGRRRENPEAASPVVDPEAELRDRGPWEGRRSEHETLTDWLSTNVPDPDAADAPRFSWAVFQRARLAVIRGKW